jgi:hypothetical protein
LHLHKIARNRKITQSAAELEFKLTEGIASTSRIWEEHLKRFVKWPNDEIYELAAQVGLLRGDRVHVWRDWQTFSLLTTPLL